MIGLARRLTGALVAMIMMAPLPAIAASPPPPQPVARAEPPVRGQPVHDVSDAVGQRLDHMLSGTRAHPAR